MDVLAKSFNVGKRILRVRAITRSLSGNGDFMKSMYADIEIPKAHIVEFVMRDFGKWHNKVATECAITQKRYTFEELRKKSITLGKCLRKIFQLSKGDVVGIFLPNNPDYPIVAFGIILAGLTVTTINPTYTVDELERHLKDSNAKVIFTYANYWDIVQQAIQKLKATIPVVVIKVKAEESIPDKAINYDDLFKIKVDLPDIIPVEDEQVVVLPYSSGTTGLPKGVMLTNGNLVANVAQHLPSEVKYVLEATDNYQEVLPVMVPMYHIYGFTASTMVMLNMGCKLVTIPKFTPDSFLAILAQHKPTILHLVPPLVNFLTSYSGVKTQYFERLRAILCAGAPLGTSDEDKFRKTLVKPIQIIQAYGMTETSPLACMISQLHEGKYFGTFGHPVANTLVKVVNPTDPTLRHLEPNQPGELLIKGPQVMKGYHNKPEETENAFSDGWYRTGDIVMYNEDKMFYITDRIKDLVKVKGFQVAPAELEEIIRSFPGVSDAAVIGIPHDYLGESPRAYIVEKSGNTVDAQKLIEYVQSKVSKHKRLAGGVAIIDNIPKNPSGKILRKELRSLYREHGI